MSDEKEIIEELSELQKCILLLTCADNKSPIRGDTWFQKELFLIAKNFEEIGTEASFESDFFGPFSESSEEQLSDLEQEELIERNGKKIVISKLGETICQDLIKNSNKEYLEAISEFKKLLNDLNEDEVLTLVYFTFPETTEESQVKERIIKNRVKNSISLYKKGKVSLSKAAEIAGKTIEEITNLVH